MHVEARRRTCRTIAGLILVGSALASAADEDWQWLNPLPQGNSLEAVWVAPGGEAFAVGDCGTILSFDGTTWAVAASGSAHEGWPDTYWFADVWGSSAADVFAVGGHGTIVHFDGTEWTAMESGTQRDLLAVWGASASDVWAAGDDGTIVHFDGVAWSPVSGVGEEPIEAIWGSSATDVFAVGYRGTVLHFDGVIWSAMVAPTSVDFSHFSAVWGSAPDDVYAAGAALGWYWATLWHYDGSSWSEVSEGRTATGPYGGRLAAIWGSAADDVWACSETEAVLHFDGGAWTTVEAPSRCAGIAGRAADDVWAVSDHHLLHFDGSEWRDTNPATTTTLWDVWGSSATDVYAVGSNGCAYCNGWEAVITRFDGAGWHEVVTVEPNSFPNAVWGSAADDVFVVGDPALVLHYDGAVWTNANEGLPSDAHLRDV